MDVRVKNELKRGLESANQLRLLFAESRAKPDNQNKEMLIASMNHHSSVVLDTFEATISMLKNRHQSKDFVGNGVGKSSDHRTSVRRTIQPQPVKMIKSTEIPEDGYSWRKYGQKPIANTKHPREYYKCGQQSVGCPARKQVQMVSENPTKYGIIYYSNHTCQHLQINGYAYDSQYELFVNPFENECEKMLCFGSSNSPINVVKESSNLMKQEQEIINEEIMPSSLPQHLCGPSSSDLPGLVSLDPWVQEADKEVVGLPDWRYRLDSPIYLDEDFKYLLTDGADFNGIIDGFDEPPL